MSWNLPFINSFCYVSYQKKFESTHFCLRVWKKPFLKVGYIWFWWFFQNCFAIPYRIQMISNSVKKFLIKFKKWHISTFRLKCVLSKFFWYKTTTKTLRNCKDQLFWCQDNSGIFQQNWTKINPWFWPFLDKKWYLFLEKMLSLGMLLGIKLSDIAKMHPWYLKTNPSSS